MHSVIKAKGKADLSSLMYGDELYFMRVGGQVLKGSFGVICLL